MNFVMNSASPAFAFSGGAITAVSETMKPKRKTREKKVEEKRKCMEGYGLEVEVKQEVDRRIMKWAFMEQSVGANDEARLCLKSVAGTDWLACEDLPDYVKDVAAVWETRVKEGRKGLKINLVFPEDDILVGPKGIRYFEDCWLRKKCGPGVEVGVEHMKGADHDSTASSSEGYIGRMFREIAGGESRYASA